ncbi:MAG: tRNA dihydrouridine(16) synthase DusC [Rhizobacter sp.]
MLLLAPMEGLLDATLRDVLTRVGGIDRCVSEFIRVTGTLLPKQAFIRVMPELLNQGRTPAGVPVRGQLLGSDPVCLAENAARLAELGPTGVDLNFGCPAKAVNRHRGGAVLLDEPELIAAIVSAVRRAVPAHLPVSAKMRLGYMDEGRMLECAHAIEDAGASELVVHARTKAHGYRPPAYWERIREIKNAVKLPVVANGEIWSVLDARRCREVSGCHTLMLGRGMVANPGLALAIVLDAQLHGAPTPTSTPATEHAVAGGTALLSWMELMPLLQLFWQLVSLRVEARHRAGRLKQWLNYLRRYCVDAQLAYDRVRTINDPQQLADVLFPGDLLQTPGNTMSVLPAQTHLGNSRELSTQPPSW